MQGSKILSQRVVSEEVASTGLPDLLYQQIVSVARINPRDGQFRRIKATGGESVGKLLTAFVRKTGEGTN